METTALVFLTITAACITLYLVTDIIIDYLFDGDEDDLGGDEDDG